MGPTENGVHGIKLIHQMARLNFKCLEDPPNELRLCGGSDESRIMRLLPLTLDRVHQNNMRERFCTARLIGPTLSYYCYVQSVHADIPYGGHR